MYFSPSRSRLANPPSLLSASLLPPSPIECDSPSVEQVRHRARRTGAQLELPHVNLKSVSNAIQMGFSPHLGGGGCPARSRWAHQAPQVFREVIPAPAVLISLFPSSVVTSEMQFGQPAEAFGRPGRRPVLLEENARPPGCPHRGAGPTHPLAEGNARSLVIGKHSDADVTTNTTAGTTADYNFDTITNTSAGDAVN